MNLEDFKVDEGFNYDGVAMCLGIGSESINLDIEGLKLLNEAIEVAILAYEKSEKIKE